MMGGKGEFEGVIGWEGYQIPCIIGVHSFERERVQTLSVDLRAPNLFSASVSDALSDTIDYTALAEICQKVAEKGRFHLLEALAWQMIEAIFLEYPLPWVWIKIQKPEAMQGMQAAIVELKRYRALYPSELKNWNLGSAKASGFDLSLEPKSNSSTHLGI